MSDEVLKELTARITKTLEDLRAGLAKIRTGRASLGMLDGIKVDYYGTPTPLAQCAALAVPEPRMITVKPWDKSIMKEIERSIREANLGLNPMNDGELIRLPKNKQLKPRLLSEFSGEAFLRGPKNHG